eukprot:gene20499-biopygen7061
MVVSAVPRGNYKAATPPEADLGGRGNYKPASVGGDYKPGERQTQQWLLNDTASCSKLQQDVAHLQRNAARCCKMLQDAANLRCITGHAYEWHCKLQQVAARCITLAMECSKMQQDAAKCCKMQQNTAAPNSMLCCIRTGTHKYSILQQVAARCCICGFIL